MAQGRAPKTAYQRDPKLMTNTDTKRIEHWRLLALIGALMRRHDVRRGATNDSAVNSGADAQIGRHASASDTCTARGAYGASKYIDGKLRMRRFR
eukprot:4769186-Pleurochrysis_carterae.AAC.3